MKKIDDILDRLVAATYVSDRIGVDEAKKLLLAAVLKALPDRFKYDGSEEDMSQMFGFNEAIDQAEQNIREVFKK
jgi:hypothetical protein